MGTITIHYFVASASSSKEETIKDFPLHTMSNIFYSHAFNSATFLKNVSTINDTPHEEITSNTMDIVHLNLNHSMLNKIVARECDMFSGMWVHDTSYPLYLVGQCPHLIEGRLNYKKNVMAQWIPK